MTGQSCVVNERGKLLGSVKIFSRFFSALRRLGAFFRNASMRGYLRVAFPGIRFHRSVRIGRGVTIRAFDGATIEIGENSEIADYAQLQAEGGRLVIGRDCLIGRGAVIVCDEYIEIGDGTLTAEHVTIRDQDHRHLGDERLERQGLVTSPIVIGHDVWLAAKVTITRGVTIAPHCVVAANAVVTRNLEVRGVYGGVPARLLNSRG